MKKLAISSSALMSLVVLLLHSCLSNATSSLCDAAVQDSEFPTMSSSHLAGMLYVIPRTTGYTGNPRGVFCVNTINGYRSCSPRRLQRASDCKNVYKRDC
ncbi:hypothetical protein RJT34_18413 [Clitoria ternatea]|uniref:Uncharacterized protein n=1 Tax=Clitoria ternatea TaxID=43366 RepID=A0AAN9PFF1_CLITE